MPLPTGKNKRRNLLPEDELVTRPVFAFFLFALAFTVRAIFAVQWSGMPYGDAPLLDAKMYDDWAWRWAQGQSIGHHAFYQSPLYPFVLSLIYRLQGHSYLAVSMLGDLFDSGAVLLIGLIAWDLFGKSAAFCAGLLAAFYMPMIFYAAPPMKEPVALFLLALFLWTGLRAYRGKKLHDYLLCGLIFGFAALARGNLLLLLPVLPAFAYARYKKQAAGVIALFLAGFIIALAPATIYNFHMTHDFVPVTYADGFNLYIGHSPYANGTNSYPPEISTDPNGERLQITYKAQQEAGHALSPSEISSFWRHKAYAFAFHHPLRELELLGLKLFAFWNGGDAFDNYDIGFIRDNYPSILNMPLPGFALISALAAFAVCAGAVRRRAGHLFLLAGATLYMASVLIFYVTDRYRLPIVVFLLPLAGAALPQAITLFRKPDKRALAAGATGGFFFLLVALAPPAAPQDLTAFDWGVLSTIYADKGEDQLALTAFRKGAAISPQQVGLQAYTRIGDVCARLFKPHMAQRVAEDEVKYFPDNGMAYYDLGRMQAMQGNLGDALDSMQKAKARDPSYALIYVGLAEIYLKQNDAAAAQAALAQGLAVDPDEPHLLSLGMLKTLPAPGSNP